MTRNWHNPQRPTPAELAAWVEGELDAADAARVEAWLHEHPDDAADAEASSRLTSLFREYPPADPSPEAWKLTLAHVAARAAVPGTGNNRRPRWQALLLIGLAAAAAVLACVVATRALWPTQGGRVDERIAARPKLPPEDDNDEPFAVASAGEIDILQMDAKDAGRLMIGQLLEPFVIASSEDVELVNAEPGDEGMMPRLQKEPFPMVVVVRADKEP